MMIGSIWAATSWKKILEPEEDLENLLEDETEEIIRPKQSNT